MSVILYYLILYIIYTFPIKMNTPLPCHKPKWEIKHQFPSETALIFFKQIIQQS